MKLRHLLEQMDIVHKKLGTSAPMICGGTPRDRYMKQLDNISDLDICTGDKTVDSLSLELFNTLKGKYNITRKVMEDGHSSIFMGNLKLDFSSNFNAPNIDQLLLNKGIKKPTSLQKEIFSRDFTCNALLLSLDLKQVFDPTHQGFEDINNKIIKTCLSPEITLTTNKNRVVRAIYLACKLDFEIDESIINFVKKNPDSVKISTEKSMVEKLTSAFQKNGEKAASLLDRMGLWNYVSITEVMYPYYVKHAKKGQL